MRHADILMMLDKHGILPTPQRLEVAEILLKKPQHLSVEQICGRLGESGAEVSKATVYNTLNLFAERGLVKELSVDPDRRVFDSSTHPHHHCYNIDTGELSDIDDQQLEVSKMPALPEGTELNRVEILIRVRNRQN